MHLEILGGLMPDNILYYGDNLHVLRDHINDESVDLIYLDPPFNSNRSYNVLFKDKSGQGGDAQIAVFITLKPPTRDMETEAVSSGFYKSDLWQKEYPHIQIYTIEQLLAGTEIKMPPYQPSFKQASKETNIHSEQGKLDL